MTKKALPSAAHALLMLIAVFPLLLSTSLALPPAENLQVKPALSSLAYFTGDWECSGKFDSSGKSIDAHQHFAPELDGNWISFRHDDKPPFGYHSLAELGWDAESKKFVMIVQDSIGGARLFRSTGWNAAQLQWTGDALGSASAPGQQFTFERLDDRNYRMSYFVRKKADWSRVDSSLCSKQ
jgi:hypothetical protein